MNYHTFESQKAFEESKVPLSPWDVLVFLDTRDVYSVPQTGGEPTLAFNAKPRDLPIPQSAATPAARITLPAIGDKPLMRVRFESKHSDSRPVAWPIKHPYWCSGTFTYHDEKGELADGCIIVAYVEDLADVNAAWPEAGAVHVMDADQNFYTFTDRFLVPEHTLLYYGVTTKMVEDLRLRWGQSVINLTAIYPDCHTPSGAAALIHREETHRSIPRMDYGSSDAVLRSKHAAAEAQGLGGDDDIIEIEIGDKKLSF